MADESKIPKGRVRRSAKLGSVLGGQAARYAGTRAANVARPEETRHERLEQRHLETAMKMVGALGQMKGAAMKLGQFASFIDTEFIPEEYREIYQEQLAKLRTDAPAMPWEKVVAVLEEEFDGEPLSELFAEIEEEAFAAASIGQVHRARLLDGRRVAPRGGVDGALLELDLLGIELLRHPEVEEGDATVLHEDVVAGVGVGVEVLQMVDRAEAAAEDDLAEAAALLVRELLDLLEAEALDELGDQHAAP